MSQVYTTEEWPHGLRCMDCGRDFIEGQPISERLDSMTTVDGDPAAYVDLICVPCAAIAAVTGEQP